MKQMFGAIMVIYVLIVAGAVIIGVKYGPDLVTGIVDRFDHLIDYPEK